MIKSSVDPCKGSLSGKTVNVGLVGLPPYVVYNQDGSISGADIAVVKLLGTKAVSDAY